MSENDTRQIGPYEVKGYVILNHLGQVWGPHVFGTDTEAAAYLNRQRVVMPIADLSKHRVVPGYSHTFALVRKEETGE